MMALFWNMFIGLFILGVIVSIVYFFGPERAHQALLRVATYLADAYVDFILFLLDQITKERVLYAATLLIEIILGFVRGGFWVINLYLALAVPFFLIALFNGHLARVGFSWVFEESIEGILIPSLVVGAWRGFSPILKSILAFAGFNGGHRLTRYVLGAREASTREREKIKRTLETIVQNAPQKNIKGFTNYFILDNPFDQVNLIGTTLYISSGAVNSDNLLVLLAHEIGHLNQKDGAKILALRQLIFPLYQMYVGGVQEYSTNRANPKPELKEFDFISVQLQMINRVWFFWISFWGGGLGPWLLSHQWAKYFRSRDYLADDFVASLGLKDQLIEYLEETKFFDTSVPYMLGWRPANELRIDHLMYLKVVAPIQETPPEPEEPSDNLLLPELEHAIEELRTLGDEHVENVLSSFGGAKTLDEVKNRMSRKKQEQQERVASSLKKYVMDAKAAAQPPSN